MREEVTSVGEVTDWGEGGFGADLCGGTDTGTGLRWALGGAEKPVRVLEGGLVLRGRWVPVSASKKVWRNLLDFGTCRI